MEIKANTTRTTGGILDHHTPAMVLSEPLFVPCHSRTAGLLRPLLLIRHSCWWWMRTWVVARETESLSGECAQVVLALLAHQATCCSFEAGMEPLTRRTCPYQSNLMQQLKLAHQWHTRQSDEQGHTQAPLGTMV